MFRFIIDDIPELGRDVTRTLDAAWAAPFCGAQFRIGTGGVRVALTLTRAESTVAVRGHLAGELSFVCSRCAESAPFDLEYDFSHMFIEEAARPKVPADVDDPGEVDVTMFVGAEIDLEPLVGEDLAVSLPFVPLCSEACRGLCQRCGKNLNEGPCACQSDEEDPRWAALHRVKLEGGSDAGTQEENV